MSQFSKINDVFCLLYKDGKIFLLILATILITLSCASSYFVQFPLISLARVLVAYVPFAFTGLILAWIITDKSFLRTPYPYLGVFLLLFIYRIYWTVFYYIFTPTYDTSSQVSDALALGTGNYLINSNEWLNLYDNATYLFIIVELIVLIGVFLLFWYLTKPFDFLKQLILF